MSHTPTELPDASWRSTLLSLSRPSPATSAWQLASTVTVAASLVALAHALHAIHWALTIPVTFALAACLVRLFVLLHDCSHGSFFASRRANDLIGTVLGWWLFTPYRAWQRQHAIHHTAAGNLTRRGTGDIWTLTSREYAAAGVWRRLAYRIARNPIALCLGGGIVTFLVLHRLPLSSLWGFRLEWVHVRDILVTSLAGIAIAMGLYWTSPFLLLAVYYPAAGLAAAFGMWLFFVQHQFEDVYWRHHDDWTFERGAVEGSSYLELTGLLHWMTASIGVHHVHHLAPSIPNYHLVECANVLPDLTARVTRLTWWSALGTFRLKLYDEDARELITFAEHRTRSARRAGRVAAPGRETGKGRRNAGPSCRSG